jgi:hypothetical protein
MTNAPVESKHYRLKHIDFFFRDTAMLKRVIEDVDKVHSLQVRRSLAHDMDAMQYALKIHNNAAFKVLMQERKKKFKPTRVGEPECRWRSRNRDL